MKCTELRDFFKLKCPDCYVFKVQSPHLQIDGGLHEEENHFDVGSPPNAALLLIVVLLVAAAGLLVAVVHADVQRPEVLEVLPHVLEDVRVLHFEADEAKILQSSAV